VLATLGTGEHYFVDLVVAFPFAVLMESLCEYSLALNHRGRIIAFAFGLISTLAWLFALRYMPGIFWSSAILPWTLCAATIAASLICERQLQRAARFRGANTA